MAAGGFLDGVFDPALSVSGLRLGGGGSRVSYRLFGGGFRLIGGLGSFLVSLFFRLKKLGKGNDLKLMASRLNLP